MKYFAILMFGILQNFFSSLKKFFVQNKILRMKYIIASCINTSLYLLKINLKYILSANKYVIFCEVQKSCRYEVWNILQNKYLNNFLISIFMGDK